MTIKRILCPTDFSTNSRVAFDYARQLAEKLQAKVTLLHVSPMPTYVMPEGTFAPVVDMGMLMDSAQQELDAWIAKYAQETSAEIDSELLQGSPYRGINTAANSMDADLIVLGTHGRSGLSRLVMGSVAERVLRTSTRPVLTIPASSVDTVRPQRTSVRVEG